MANAIAAPSFYEGEKLVVTAHGLESGSADLAVLAGERGKAAINLAKLVLIDMVRDALNIRKVGPGLSLQGSTTRLLCGGSTTSDF